jgi:transcriptional regulator with XRE-family HTH domain
MEHSSTAAEWETELGTQLRALRLRRGIDQVQLARVSGIALNAVKNLESGRGATVSSLIKVLRALERTDWLKSLAPAVSISPLQMLKTKEPRQRAPRRQKKQNV